MGPCVRRDDRENYSNHFDYGSVRGRGTKPGWQARCNFSHACAGLRYNPADDSRQAPDEGQAKQRERVDAVQGFAKIASG